MNTTVKIAEPAIFIRQSRLKTVS